MTPPAFQVELTAGAEEDLRVLYRYLAEHASVEQGDALLDVLLEKIETLELWPERGSVPKELETLGIREFRQVLLAPWRPIYRVVEQRVIVMIIADGHRDMQFLLERRLLGR